MDTTWASWFPEVRVALAFGYTRNSFNGIDDAYWSDNTLILWQLG